MTAEPLRSELLIAEMDRRRREAEELKDLQAVHDLVWQVRAAAIRVMLELECRT